MVKHQLHSSYTLVSRSSYYAVLVGSIAISHQRKHTLWRVGCKIKITSKSVSVEMLAEIFNQLPTNNTQIESRTNWWSRSLKSWLLVQRCLIPDRLKNEVVDRWHAHLLEGKSMGKNYRNYISKNQGAWISSITEEASYHQCYSMFHHAFKQNHLAIYNLFH